MKLCLNLAFSCTLRIGELLALTWDCVDISDESIQAGKASISVTKELQRVSKKAMKALDSKDIITVFPDQGLHNRTALVLKAPKTPTSIRKVFLPKTVAEMLVAWKMEQDAAIEAIGNEYADFNLVIATPVGLPCESAQIRKALKNLIEENNLPPVVFHSLNQALMKISLYDLGMLEFYLVYFDFQLKASAQEHGHGIALKNIPPFDVLKKYLMPVPPLQEQSRIIRELASILQLLNAIDADRADISDLITRTKEKVLDLAIRGKLVPQNPEDEPAAVLVERIRAEKEMRIKQGTIKRDKRESIIFRGDDNSYYEKVGDQRVCIDDDLPYSLPEGWVWCELQDCCIKEIKRGRSPKYADNGHVLSFAQKCNQKTGGINMGLALLIDDSTACRYEDDEYLQDGDIVINSTGTGTLGRVGIYRATDNLAGTPVVPDSHVTVVRVSSLLDPLYFFYCLKSMQSRLETLGEGSTNQKELKPLTVQQLRIPIPPIAEQNEIVKQIVALFGHLDAIATDLT